MWLPSTARRRGVVELPCNWGLSVEDTTEMVLAGLSVQTKIAVGSMG